MQDQETEYTPANTLVLKRFCGNEIFRITEASITHYIDEDDRYAISFEVKTDKTSVKSLPDTESLHAHPHAEFTLHCEKPPGACLFSNRRFQIPSSFDKTIGDHVTNLYYVKHQGIDAVEIVILKRLGPTSVRAMITGTTCDVNYYNGSKPPTIIMIEATFDMASGIHSTTRA